MGQCCAGEKQKNNEEDDQIERLQDERLDDVTSDVDDYDYRRDIKDKGDDYTERDPLLSDKSPVVNYSQSAEHSPVHHNQLQKEGDFNQRSADVSIAPPVHHDVDDYPNSSAKPVHRDPHAVIQKEPYRPGQDKKYQPAQREPHALNASYELPYDLNQAAPEKEPHYPIQEEGLTTTIPVDLHKHEFDDQALQLTPAAELPQHHNLSTHTQMWDDDDKHEKDPLIPSMSKNTTPMISDPTTHIDEETIAHKMPSSLRKAEIKSYISGSYDHSGGILTSGDSGLKLIIPEGAIMDGDLVTLYIAIGLYGPFKLPPHCQLASPYYWISVSGSYHFYKPIQVEFEHFAVVTACDPSHYQLLTCEDDDESYSMQPVNYELKFRVQGNVSLCTFHTYHFCSHCLSHNCKDPMINKIGAFFLKQRNFQSLDEFTVEIWFSFPISYCMKRNEELYTKKGMILHSDSTSIFEASSNRSSRSYFSLSYKHRIYGWHIDHFRFKDIPTEQVNFYNHFTSMKELEIHEEQSLFPPRFILKVSKKCQYNTDLNTYITVTLCKTKEKKSTDFILCVPVSTTTEYTTTSLVKDKSFSPTSIATHNCHENRPTIADLRKFSESISIYWEEIAIMLGVSKDKVSTIDIDYPYSQKKCFKMFNTWLDTTVHPCWCDFIKALCAVGLERCADDAKAHLIISESVSENKSVASLDINEGDDLQDDTTNLQDLVQFLSDIPKECNLKYFIIHLFPKESAMKVITDIRPIDVRREDQIKKICEAFSKEKDSSWAKVYRALKKANCNDLADYVKVSFL